MAGMYVLRGGRCYADKLSNEVLMMVGHVYEVDSSCSRAMFLSNSQIGAGKIL